MLDFLQIRKETEQEFETIAQILFDNYAIKTHDTFYRLAELEFYWNSSDHVDDSTYKRNHVDPKSGDWFFHFSGVDIALRNEQTGGYGGILIRSIYDVNSNKLVKGPLVCVMKLFSENCAFEQPIVTQIVPYKFSKSTIIKSTRVGLGKNAKNNGADKFNYAFSIKC